MLTGKARPPNAVLKLPSVLAVKASRPIAVLLSPVVIASKAVNPVSYTHLTLPTILLV